MTPAQRRHYALHGPWTGDHYHPTKTRKPRWFWLLYLAAIALVVALAVWAGLA